MAAEASSLIGAARTVLRNSRKPLSCEAWHKAVPFTSGKDLLYNAAAVFESMPGHPMKCRVSFHEREKSGVVRSVATLIDDDWEIVSLPAIGHRVVLPVRHLVTIREKVDLPVFFRSTKRFEVVAVEHRWDEVDQGVYVGIAVLSEAWKAFHCTSSHCPNSP